MHVALKLCHVWPKHGISLPVTGETWVATAISLLSRGNGIMTPCLIAWYQIKHDTMFDCLVSNQTWHHVWLYGIKSNMTPCLIAWYQIKHDTMFYCMASNQAWHHDWLYGIKHDTMFDCLVSNQTWHHVWLYDIKSNMTPCLIVWYQIKHDTMFDCMA